MERDLIHQPNDKLFKLAMKELSVAKEFFQTYLSPSLLKEFDLNTLKLEPTSFVTGYYKKIEADIIYSVKKGGKLAYLYLLCEEQTNVDPYMAFRLEEYRMNMMRHYWGKDGTKDLPLVYPLVYYVGSQNYNAPRHITELFGEQEELAREIMYEPHLLIDVHKIEDTELRSKPWIGLMGYMMKYRKKRVPEEFWSVVFPWLNEIDEAGGEDYVKNVLLYAVNELDVDEEKIFIEQANKWLSQKLRGDVMTLAQRFERNGFEQGLDQGLEQGLEQGQEQRSLEIARDLKALGLLPEDDICKVTRLSREQLAQLESENEA